MPFHFVKSFQMTVCFRMFLPFVRAQWEILIRYLQKVFKRNERRKKMKNIKKKSTNVKNIACQSYSFTLFLLCCQNIQNEINICGNMTWRSAFAHEFNFFDGFTWLYVYARKRNHIFIYSCISSRPFYSWIM